MGGVAMLQQELESLRQRALNTIIDYVKKNGKHGYVLIEYKGNPECYVSFLATSNIPYMQWYDVKGNNRIRINGDTLDGIVEIADAIEEYKENIDWAIYPQVSTLVKATSMEDAKEKATQYLIDKGIPKELIIITNDNCHKV